MNEHHGVGTPGAPAALGRPEGQADGGPGRRQGPARDAEASALRRAGWTYRAIGERFGVTAERVRQLCLRAERRAREANIQRMVREAHGNVLWALSDRARCCVMDMTGLPATATRAEVRPHLDTLRQEAVAWTTGPSSARPNNFGRKALAAVERWLSEDTPA